MTRTGHALESRLHPDLPPNTHCLLELQWKQESGSFYTSWATMRRAAVASALARRLEICLLTVALVLAAALVKLDFVLEAARRNPFTLGLSLFAGLLLLGGFAVGAVSLLLPGRERLFGQTDLESLAQKPGGSDPAILANCALAALRKTRQRNESREIWLKGVLILVLAGVAATFIFVVAAVLSQPQAKPAASRTQPKPAASAPKTTAAKPPKAEKAAAKPANGSTAKATPRASRPKK